MKNLFLGLSLAAMALLAACSSGSGTNSEPLENTSNSSSGADLFAETFDDLPVCTANREGAIAYVKDEKAAYACEGGDWTLDDENTTERKSNGDTDNGGNSSASGNKKINVPGGSSDASVYDADKNTLKDLRDGQTYKTVKIGDQVWMAENLNFVTDNSWCYNDESDNCAKYGRLYTWAAAVGRDEDECGYEHTCGLGSGDIRGACPKGWHLPSKAEWEALIVAVDGSKLKSVTGWSSSGNGTNAFGFSALPAGYRYYGGGYNNEGDSADFWSSAEYNSYLAYYMNLYYNDDSASLGNANKLYGFSVRCLKD